MDVGGQAAVAGHMGEPTPWERRREIGYWNGFKDTVVAVLGRPSEIFGRMLPDTDDGTLLYFVFVSIIPDMVALATAWARFDLESVDQVMKMAPKGMPDAFKSVFELYASPLGLALALGAVALFKLFSLMYWAGCTHLLLRLFAQGGRGWTATYKTFVYASTPDLINVVPMCGGIVALVWTWVAGVIGLSRIHGVSALVAFAAMFLGLLVPACLLSCGAGALMPLLMHK
jgi:hypothetical protein